MSIGRIFFLCIATVQVLFGALHVNLTPEEQQYVIQKSSLKVCTNPSLMPFEVLTPEGHHEGIAADLLTLVAERLGFKLEIIQTYTKEESLDKAKKGACDIVSFVIQTPELDEWMYFSEPILVDKNVLITRDSHPFLGDLKYLNSGALALQRGSPIFHKIESEYPNITLFTVASEEDALILVANKQVDMTIRSFARTAYSIKQQGFFNLKISGQVEGVDTLFRIGMPRNDSTLLTLPNKGIQSISLGEREAILNRYIPAIVQQKISDEIWYALGTIVLIISVILLWNYMLRKEVKKEIAINAKNQKMMLQQAKKAALGELIGNISHQWREPLSQLSGINLIMIGMLEHDKPISSTFLHQQLKTIENTLDFMSQTMQNFLEFYKPSTFLQHFSIYDSIEQTLSLVETNILSYAINVRIEGDGQTRIYGIKNEYMQIWLNILNNAIHALIESSVAQKEIVIEIKETTIRFSDNAGGKVEPNDFLKGVGLMMCERILEKYHQHMRIFNYEKGVCVEIFLSHS